VRLLLPRYGTFDICHLSAALIRWCVDFTVSCGQMKRQQMVQQASSGLQISASITNTKSPFDVQEPLPPPPLVVQELANLSLSRFRGPTRIRSEVRVKIRATWP
jgi:hypothetical protein